MTATTALVAACCVGVLSSLPVTLSLPVHPVFLETNMKAAWTALLAEGDRHQGGAGGLLDAMLRDCHGRRSEAWGAECDRALYLEAVLDNAAQLSATPIIPTLPHAAVDGGDEEQRTAQPRAEDIAVVESGMLPFSSFFLGYAVPKRPVILSQQRGEELIISGNSTSPAGESDAKTTTAGIIDEDPPTSSGEKVQSQPATPSSSSGYEDWIVNGRLVDLVAACAPYPDDGEPADGGGTVERSLSLCHKSVLENLPVSLYVAGDFAQRYRRQGVLPPEDIPEVERFVSG